MATAKKTLLQRIDSLIMSMVIGAGVVSTLSIMQELLSPWPGFLIAVGIVAVVGFSASITTEHCKRGFMFSPWHVIVDVFLVASLVASIVLKKEFMQAYVIGMTTFWLFGTWVLARFAEHEKSLRQAATRPTELVRRNLNLVKSTTPELERECWSLARDTYANIIKDPLAEYACERIIEKLPADPPPSA